jgi:GalNAc-alpha-(1->4)-GalNAc-alpha-(1->3)-diNAcBac-PP-undecaprenol alpha-1,4-N-acetyl-D-galactosaminyltransferase
MLRRVDFKADLILVCNSLDAGGIERVVSTLANEWSRRGRKVCVITQYDRERFYALDPEVHHVIMDRAVLGRVVELPGRLKSRVLRFAFPRRPTNGHAHARGAARQRLAEKLYGVNFSLFYSYETSLLRRAIERVESPLVVSFGTSLNIMTLKACRGLDRRVVVSERSDAVPDGWGLLSQKFYHLADVVTANSRGALRELGGFVDARKLAFVPNPLVLPGRDREDDGDGPPRPRVFLTVARLVWDKAYDVLLDAFAKLGEEFNDWRLAIVGSGHLEARLRAQAEELGIARRVDWHGIVPDPHAFYRASSVFVLPSRIEGMPNSLLEAMGSGLPVVVSDGTPGPLELVEDNVNGLVVHVNDSASLASALARLARDSELRMRLGRAARERAREHELPRAVAAWESAIGIADGNGDGRRGAD